MPITRRNLIEIETQEWRPPLLDTNPTPAQRIMAAAHRYFDLYAGSVWNDMAIVLQEQTGRILDIDCGTQPFRPLLNKDAQYIGLNTSAAKNYFGYETPDTIYYDGADFPFESESFDAVLCTETMEHVFDGKTFTNELNRIIRPSGTLIAIIPFASHWHFAPYDYKRYTPANLNRLLTSASFENVQVFARGNRVSVECYKLMALILSPFFDARSHFLAKLPLMLISLLFLPLLIILAAIGNISLSNSASKDCLGYTVIATKSTPAAKES